MDKRYQLCKERFETLSTEEIQRMIDNQHIMCFDTYNFDEDKKTFCPIAIAMNLHISVLRPTNRYIGSKIGERFYPTNIFKGVEGEFYTTNRQDDIVNLCKEIINDRKKKGATKR